ncbi:MAG TPA: hypothetical protein VGM36_08180, partial [Rhizomicrobium sp.]
AFACAPALAQSDSATPDASAPPQKMSCDDLMTNAELKFQTVIDADKKALAEEHMKAAEDAITNNDPDGCRAQVQQALDAVN